MWVDAVVIGGGVYSSYRRGVVLIPGEYWVVYDVLPPFDEDNQFDFGFQSDPGCKVTEMGPRSVAVGNENGRSTTAIVGSSGLSQVAYLEGSLAPLGGWISPRYGEMVPAPQVRFRVAGNTRLTAFLLRCSPGVQHAEIEAKELADQGVQLNIRSHDLEDTLLLNLGPAECDVRTDDVVFRGDLAWLRSFRGQGTHLRWLRGSALDVPSMGISVKTETRTATLEISCEPGNPIRVSEPAVVDLQWRR